MARLVSAGQACRCDQALVLNRFLPFFAHLERLRRRQADDILVVELLDDTILVD